MKNHSPIVGWLGSIRPVKTVGLVNLIGYRSINDFKG